MGEAVAISLRRGRPAAACGQARRAARCRVPAPQLNCSPQPASTPPRSRTRRADWHSRLPASRGTPPRRPKARSPAMPLATPAQYAEMLDAAKAGGYAIPAVNVSSSTTLNAAILGFVTAGSDGIVQVSRGGGDFAAGPAKDRALGARALADYAAAVAEQVPILVVPHGDHCPPGRPGQFPSPPARRVARTPPAGRVNRSSSRRCSTDRACPSKRTSPSPPRCSQMRRRRRDPRGRDRRRRRRGGRHPRRRLERASLLHPRGGAGGHRRARQRRARPLPPLGDVRQRPRPLPARPGRPASRRFWARSSGRSPPATASERHSISSSTAAVARHRTRSPRQSATGSSR